MMKCTNCDLKYFCAKGCLGSQYENQHEMFASNDSVCKMFETKYVTIHEIAEKYGIYDIIEQAIEIPLERRKFINYVREVLSKHSL